MKTSYALTRKTANSSPEIHSGRFRNELRLIQSVAVLARSLWPTNTASELSKRTGRSQRQCEYYLAKKFNLDAEALINLLRSPDGLAFLKAALGDQRPEWFRDFEQNIEIAQLRRNINVTKKRLEEIGSCDA